MRQRDGNGYRWGGTTLQMGTGSWVLRRKYTVRLCRLGRSGKLCRLVRLGMLVGRLCMLGVLGRLVRSGRFVRLGR